MMAAILKSAIMDSAIFLKTLSPINSIWLKLIHSDSTWWWQPSWIQPFFTKINFTHSFWLNLMVAAILNSDIMDSAIFLKTLTQTNSFWLNLIHSHLTWWWQPSWTLPGWIQILPSWIQHLVIFSQIHSKTLSLHSTPTNSIWLKLIHSHLTWWWQPYCILPSWILPSWIHPFSSKLWLQLIQSDSKSFILTQLDDGSHLGFSHFSQK